MDTAFKQLELGRLLSPELGRALFSYCDDRIGCSKRKKHTKNKQSYTR
jgi:hypothetical protein